MVFAQTAGDVASLLFGAGSFFERGAWEECRPFFAPGATIRQVTSPSSVPISFDEFIEQMAGPKGSLLGLPKYSQRVVSLTPDGFVEQHAITFTVQGTTVELEAVVVVRCQESHAKEGHKFLIKTLDEYVDPSPVMEALRKTQTKKKAAQLPVKPAVDVTGPGTVVLVTGASSGIGEQIALRYAKRGCSLVLAGRRRAPLEQVASTCRGLHQACQALAVVTDVSKAPDCSRLVQATIDTFGAVHRLYLNAGASQSCLLEDCTQDTVRELMDTNFYGSTVVAMEALCHLRSAARSSSGAKICVVSSLLGVVAAPRNTSYCASKWALHGFFESLRLEMLDWPVSVTLAVAGSVDTPILSDLAGPNGTRVKMDLSEKAREKLMSPAEAARITVGACEQGIREVIFPDDLKPLVKMRRQQPEAADAIVSRLYLNINLTEVAHKSKL